MTDIKITPSPYGTWEYVPSGGRVLTAEQVEDLRIVTTDVDSCTVEQFRRWNGAKDRLVDALFPATETAKEVAEEADDPRIWGIDAPEPSDARYVRDRFGTLFEKAAPNVWHRWRVAARRFGEVDWTWSELASDLPVEVLGVPQELTPPAPAVPAEEETKAEAHIEALRDLFNGGPDTAIRTTWHDGVEYWEVPADDMRKILTAVRGEQ